MAEESTLVLTCTPVGDPVVVAPMVSPEIVTVNIDIPVVPAVTFNVKKVEEVPDTEVPPPEVVA